jgi:hypothetical protein
MTRQFAATRELAIFCDAIKIYRENSDAGSKNNHHLFHFVVFALNRRSGISPGRLITP